MRRAFYVAAFGAALGCSDPSGPGPTVDNGNPPPPPATAASIRFASVTVGTIHSCALTTDGIAYCWGGNDYGMLGDGSTSSSSIPVAVAGGLRFTSLTAGHVFMCGLSTDGDAYCWGNQVYGQLGDGTHVGRATPTRVTGGIKFASLATGGYHTCGLTASGAAYCWGAGFYATLGLGPDWNDAVCGAGQHSYCARPAPVVGNLTFATLAAGDNTTCGVTTSGRAFCWGLNWNGALGVGAADGPESCDAADALDPPSLPCSLVPTPVAGGLTFQTGREQFAFGCGLSPNGVAYCWGDNAQYRLGPWAGMQECSYTVPYAGKITSPCATAPMAVASGLTFKSVYSGVGYSCGLTLNGEAYCWGSNGDGELGNGTSGPEQCRVFGANRGCSQAPRPVVGGHRFVSLAINETSEWRHHTCGVTEAGDVYCWGANDQGKLGTGTTTPSAIPLRVVAIQ